MKECVVLRKAIALAVVVFWEVVHCSVATSTVLRDSVLLLSLRPSHKTEFLLSKCRTLGVMKRQSAL